MKFFDWNQVDISKLMLQPHLMSIQRWIAIGIYRMLMDDGYVENFYQWDPEWLLRLRSLPYEEAIDVVVNTSWGKLSPIRKPIRGSSKDEVDDYNEWLTVARDEFDDNTKIAHYVYMHRCYIIALVVYYMASSLFPDKKFVICDTGRHAFVTEEDNDEVVYDIFWWYLELGLPSRPWISYDNVVEYASARLVLDDPSTEEDELRLMSLDVINRSYVDHANGV